MLNILYSNFIYFIFQYKEKKLKKLQTMTGAVGHISCEMIVDINTEVVRLMSTIQEFADPAVVIDDPRKEAAEIFSASKTTSSFPWVCQQEP